MLRFLRAFTRDESGATAIEYVLVATLISIGIVAGATIVGSKTSNSFTNVGTSLR